jgi:RpiB/LacA/LacB family sugar-phosphate isomerase
MAREKSMNIFIGADHRGFRLKEQLKDILKNDGYTVTDVGAAEYNGNDDFPDFAKAVAEQVSKAPEDTRGIVICGSGTGVDIVANKFPRIRSVLAISPDHVNMSRHDDDVNVLSIAADFTNEMAVMSILKVFLTTPFAKLEERYTRRLRKIEEIEGRKEN